MTLLRIVLPTGDKFKVIWQWLWFNERDATYNDDDDVTSSCSINHCKMTISLSDYKKSLPECANIVVYILPASTDERLLVRFISIYFAFSGKVGLLIDIYVSI